MSLILRFCQFVVFLDLEVETDSRQAYSQERKKKKKQLEVEQFFLIYRQTGTKFCKSKIETLDQ
jgi:hypothetical protein